MSEENFDVAIPALLEKSKREATTTDYPITIGISSGNVDRQNERMLLKSVFTKDTIDYHMKEGYADYDHISFRGATPLEKAQAICGKPVDFKWTKHPTSGIDMAAVEVNLFRGNPYVEHAIIPALEKGNGVFGASIGGATLQKSIDHLDENGKKVATITKIKWVHDAITPLYKAVNPDAFVQKLHKSLGTICHKAVCHDDVESKHFINNFGELVKSMMANEGATDYAGTSGGAALQPQSLEPDIASKVAAIDELLRLFRAGAFRPDLNAMREYLVNAGIDFDTATQAAKIVLKGGSK